MEQYIELGERQQFDSNYSVKYRYNTVTRRIEISGGSSFGYSEWKPGFKGQKFASLEEAQVAFKEELKNIEGLRSVLDDIFSM